MDRIVTVTWHDGAATREARFTSRLAAARYARKIEDGGSGEVRVDGAVVPLIGWDRMHARRRAVAK